MPDRLVKNCIIARSGVYQYLAEELPALGLSLKDAPEKKDVYNVYRPSVVLESNKEKFTRLPLTLGHPDQKVTGDNFRQLAVGYTGDTIALDYDTETNEVILKTSLSLADGEALRKYESGTVELSPGYDASFSFSKGKAPNGEEYDAIMTGVSDANHLALVEKARGGSSVRILDAKGGNRMLKKLISGLWHSAKKKAAGVKDTDMGAFRAQIDDLVKTRKSLSDADFQTKIDGLKQMAADLPDTDEKSKLIRFLEDFAIVREKDDAQASEAAKMIADLFEKLDTEAMAETGGEKAPEDGIGAPRKDVKPGDRVDTPTGRGVVQTVSGGFAVVKYANGKAESVHTSDLTVDAKDPKENKVAADADKAYLAGQIIVLKNGDLAKVTKTIYPNTSGKVPTNKGDIPMSEIKDIEPEAKTKEGETPKDGDLTGTQPPADPGKPKDGSTEEKIQYVAQEIAKLLTSAFGGGNTDADPEKKAEETETPKDGDFAKDGPITIQFRQGTSNQTKEMTFPSEAALQAWIEKNMADIEILRYSKDGEPTEPAATEKPKDEDPEKKPEDKPEEKKEGAKDSAFSFFKVSDSTRTAGTNLESFWNDLKKGRK